MNPRKNNPFLSITTRFLPLGIAVGGMFAQSAQALTWDANNVGALQTDGAGAWLGTNQWWDGGVNVTWSSTSDAVFGNGGAGGAVTLASPTTANSVTINPFTGTYTLGTAGQALTINTGITMNSGAGTSTFISPIILGGNVTFANNSAAALNLNATISESAAGLGLTKTGTGALSIGTTTIENGTITASNATALGAISVTSAIALGNANSISGNLSPTLQVNGNTTLARNITVGASNTSTTGIYTIGSGNGSSSATISGTVTLNQNLTILPAAGAFTISGSITSGLAVNPLVTFRNPGTVTVSGVIGGGAGTIAVTKSGTGALNFTGALASTYTGDTTLNAGGTTLNFAAMATPTDLINSGSALKLGGGTLTVQGKAGAGVATSQTFTGTTVNAGGGQIFVIPNGGASTNVNLGALTATATGGSLLVGKPIGNVTTGTILINTTSNVDSTGIYGGRVVLTDGIANTYNWATSVSGGSPYTLSRL